MAGQRADRTEELIQSSIIKLLILDQRCQQGDLCASLGVPDPARQSPRAGAFVKGAKACPGWNFWHLRTANGEVPLKDLRAELLRSDRLDTWPKETLHPIPVLRSVLRLVGPLAKRARSAIQCDKRPA